MEGENEERIFFLSKNKAKNKIKTACACKTA